jgi:hypothetical protein
MPTAIICRGVSVAPQLLRKGCAYGRRLDDRAGLDDLLLVQLRTGAVEIADNRGHTSLVAHGGREVDGLLGVILGEAGVAVSGLSRVSAVVVCNLPLHLTAVTGSALSRQEGQRPVAGGFELPVGHGEFDVLWLVRSKLSREVRCSEQSKSLWAERASSAK